MRGGGLGSVEWGEGSLYYYYYIIILYYIIWRFQLSNESDQRNKGYFDTCGTACQRRLTLAEYLRVLIMTHGTRGILDTWIRICDLTRHIKTTPSFPFLPFFQFKKRSTDISPKTKTKTNPPFSPSLPFTHDTCLSLHSLLLTSLTLLVFFF